MDVTEQEGLIYALTLDALIQRLKSEDVSAADINAARQLMKENGIQGGSAMKEKEDALSFAFPVFRKDTDERSEDIA